MSYKDDEEVMGDVDINEEEVEILDSEEDLDDPLLLDDDLLVDDELLGEEDEDDESADFAGIDGSEY
jgi:hypothetical protein